MTIDGFVRASGTEVSVQAVKAYLANNNIEKIVLVPDYQTLKSGKIIPYKGEDKPHKDLLFKFTKRISKKHNTKKTAKVITNGNFYLKELHSMLPANILPFPGINTNVPNFLNAIEKEYSLWQFAGLHLPNHLNKTDLITSEMYDFYRWVSEHKLHLIIHLNSTNDIYAIQKIIRDFKSVTFIIQHMIGLEKFDPCMAGIHNLYFDISPLHAISDHRLKMAITQFTPRSLVYGSSTPYGSHNLNEHKERIRKLVRDEYELNLIMGENWNRILSQKKKQKASLLIEENIG